MIRAAFQSGLALLLSFLLAACGSDGGGATGPDDPGEDPTVTSVTVTPSETTIEVDETTTLDASVQDAEGNALDVEVSWTSSDADVAEVTGDGVVTGVAAGEATVTATADGVTGTADVTVEEPLTETERTVVETEEIIDEVVPDPEVPLDDRNPLQELEDVADRLLDVEGIVAVQTNPVSLSAQAVLEDGTSLLFIHNRFDQEGATSSATAPMTASRPGTRAARASARTRAGATGGPLGSPPGSSEAVVVAIDGGGGVAGEVGTMLGNAGYDVSSVGGSLADMRDYSDLGVLHLDTHGAAFQRAVVSTDADGETSVSLGENRYALQTNTVVVGSDLSAIQDEFAAGDLALSVTKGSDGTVRTKVAITESFIAKNWSFDEGVVMLHACFGGSGPFKPEGSCQGACDPDAAGTFDPTPLRQAMLDAGANLVVSFDNYTATNEARPSILFFFDRMLGADEFRPRQPPARPFLDHLVQEAMTLEGLSQFTLPEVFLGIEVGTGNSVNVVFDGEAGEAQLAPTIREMEVVDDAAQASGELTLFGHFGLEPGPVTVGGTEVNVQAWGDEQVIARIPFEGAGSSGGVVVESGAGVESNEAPVTKWEGRIEIQFDPGKGSLLATSVVDMVFRGDVHPYRTRLFGDPTEQEAKAYASPASEGVTLGQGSHTVNGTTTTFYGETDMRVLTKAEVDRGGAGVTESLFGGYLEVDPSSGTGLLCMQVNGKVKSRTETAQGQVVENVIDAVFMPPDLILQQRSLLPCVEVTVGSDYTVSGGTHTWSDGDITLDLGWTQLQPTNAPDEETAG